MATEIVRDQPLINGKNSLQIQANFPIQRAIFFRRRLRVSIIRVAASKPTIAAAANLSNTESTPPLPSMKSTRVGPVAEPIRSHEVATPVPIAPIRIG